MANVLVVEDDIDWQALIKEILSDYLAEEIEELDIRIASSLVEAEYQIDKNVFDVVILDLRLSDWDDKNLDGWNIMKKFFDKISKHGTQIIICSAYGMMEQIREGFRNYRIVDFFAKQKLSSFEFGSAVRDAIKKADEYRKGLS